MMCCCVGLSLLLPPAPPISTSYNLLVSPPFQYSPLIPTSNFLQIQLSDVINNGGRRRRMVIAGGGSIRRRSRQQRILLNSCPNHDDDAQSTVGGCSSNPHMDSETESSLLGNYKEVRMSLGLDEDEEEQEQEATTTTTSCTSSRIPTQTTQSLVQGTGPLATAELNPTPTPTPTPDIDYLQELLAIQQQGPRAIGFFGTRNMGFLHQQLIEILSYAMIITKNHIFTSGASGTNAAVIRGALRAEQPELLTVILPQSLNRQPPESQELLSKVKYVVEKPYNDHLPLIEASRLCNMDILSNVQQVICFAFHDSKLLMETCQVAKDMRKIVTLFYLD